jgi:predicted N-acetyltransferase YhbS
MQPHISPITSEDLPSVADIFSQSFSETEDVNYLIGLIKDSLSDTPQYPGEFYVVAKDDTGVVLGLVGFRDVIAKFKDTGWIFYEKMGFILAGTVEGSEGGLSNVYRKSNIR